MSVTFNTTSTSSTSQTSTSETVTTAPRDNRINDIRENALSVIRSSMPITTLFNPKLNIDLGFFLKDQMFFRRIAEFLANHNPHNMKELSKLFANSEIANEIKALFKKDSDAYVELFYQACMDVLHNKTIPSKISTSLEGRIYTLRNALIAQKDPQAIIKSQKQNKITAQTPDQIKEEGECFIRESLLMHMNAIKERETKSFEEVLTSISEQLVPFVRDITIAYLTENGKECLENPLTFRNPKGYNYHGFVAGSVMEACLNALGYKTRCLESLCMEPKVTLATTHRIVVVIHDQEKFIVDPCYIQFHKDICFDPNDIPKASVLVLNEKDIPQYVEKMMECWKKTRNLLIQNNNLGYELKRKDQLMAFAIDIMPFFKDEINSEFAPQNIETWVRNALNAIWTPSSCQPVLMDESFFEIFQGTGTTKKAYEIVKQMGIAGLTSHLTTSEVEKQLQNMSLNPQLKGQNAEEALSLIAQLPDENKDKFSSLLDVDTRILSMDLRIISNAYFRSVKKVVNPEGKAISAIYGCSGADAMSVLLSTDAQDITFVDMTKLTIEDFQQALMTIKNPNIRVNKLMELHQQNGFLSYRSKWGGSTSIYNGNNVHMMVELPFKLFFDLLSLGVRLEEIVISSNKNGGMISIEFPWEYYGSNRSKKRTIHYIQADIINPNNYPNSLKAKLERGIDIFYMKGAFQAPRHYKEFIPIIAKSIKKNGWLMTSDFTFTMQEHNPEEFLEPGLFTMKHSNECKLLEESINILPGKFPYFPLLELYPPESRQYRNTASDASYWAILKLRQKL